MQSEMFAEREALIGMLLPGETAAKAMQRLRPKPRQSALKKKNIRKSELAKLQQAEANAEMEDS